MFVAVTVFVAVVVVTAAVAVCSFPEHYLRKCSEQKLFNETLVSVYLKGTK